MWTQIFDLIKGTFQEWRRTTPRCLAAALAYYTTFSLAPLLVLVIAIAGLLGGREAAQSQVMAHRFPALWECRAGSSSNPCC